MSNKMADNGFPTEQLMKQQDPKGQQQKGHHKDIFIQVMEKWNINRKATLCSWELGLILSAGFQENCVSLNIRATTASNQLPGEQWTFSQSYRNYTFLPGALALYVLE